MGELWTVARGQCRKATSDERQGVEAVMQECQDLIQEYKRNSKKAGYKDITGEASPPIEDEKTQDEHPLKRVRFNEEQVEEEEPYTPESPIATRDGEGARSSVAEPESEVSRPTSVRGGGNGSSSSSTSSSSSSTPSGGGNGCGAGTANAEALMEATEEVSSETPVVAGSMPPIPNQWENPGFQRAVDTSRLQANRLDGHPHAPSARPVRWVRGSREYDPYLVFEPEFHWITENEDPEEWEAKVHEERWSRVIHRDASKPGDFWRYEPESRSLVRCHQNKRKTNFNPVGCKDLPVPIWALQSKRQTAANIDVGGKRMSEDDWRKGSEVKAQRVWWTGQDEIDPSKEPPEELEGWKLADAAEWSKIEASGCYGLVDAPLHCRRSLLADLAKLGYHQSKLNPCIWKVHDPMTGELEGAVAIEVDDLFTVGHARHHALMKQLQQMYTFVKYVKLREVDQGAAFNGRRIRQLADGTFKIDMQKFVEERLHSVELEKGRSTQRKSIATAEEAARARAVCGSLNSVGKRGQTGCRRSFISAFV
eukprot:s847_g13.t1